MLNQPFCVFDTIIFDLDSTLVTIEGIDELARMKGVEHLIEPMTQRAMNGELSIEEAFVERLEIINPTYADVTALSELYLKAITPGAEKLIAWLHAQGKQVFVVSGGYDPAVTDFCKHLGIPPTHVFANRLHFSPTGEYLGLKANDFLWKENGKRLIIAEIQERYPGKTVSIGDGMSDLEAAEIVESFICFAGIVQRPAVMEKAQYVVTHSDLTALTAYLT